MADVVIQLKSANERGLPPVCMCCGRTSKVTVRHTFRAQNPTAGNFGALVGGVWGEILAAVFHRRVGLPVPLCWRHQWHFRVRLIVHLSALLGPYVFFAAIFVAPRLAGLEPGKAAEPDSTAGTINLAVTVGLLVSLLWSLVVILTWRSFTVCATEADGTAVRLRGVAPRFAEVVEKQRTA